MKSISTAALLLAAGCAVTALGAYVVSGTIDSAEAAERPIEFARPARTSEAQPVSSHTGTAVERGDVLADRAGALKVSGAMEGDKEVARMPAERTELPNPSVSFTPEQRAMSDVPKGHVEAGRFFRFSGRGERGSIRHAQGSIQSRQGILTQESVPSPPADRKSADRGKITDGSKEDPSGKTTETAEGRGGQREKYHVGAGAAAPRESISRPSGFPVPPPPVYGRSLRRGNFTPEQELERAQFGWQAFSEKIFGEATKAGKAEVDNAIH